jgi:hypothetical protein
LRSIAIVDENPREQFLYPEFLPKRLFESHGLTASIVDPSELEITDDGVQFGGARIDLIYNRLTDFYFAQPRTWYCARFASVTWLSSRRIRAHALYADKRNRRFSAMRRSWQNWERLNRRSTRRAGRRRLDLPGNDDAWWRDRKDWFFKPSGGFGSRGTYRGDKLTRRVFAQVMNGEYVAQRFVPAGERLRSTARGRNPSRSMSAAMSTPGRFS